MENIYYLQRLAGKLQEMIDCFPRESVSAYDCYSTLAKQMAYACDFNAELMLTAIPDFGLAEDARKFIVELVQKEDHGDSWPWQLKEAEHMLALEDGSTEKLMSACGADEAEAGESVSLSLPPLPHVLSLMTNKEPMEYRAPMIIGLLPVLGTLATHVRFTYNQVETHSLSFLSCLEAPSAGGKSFIKRHVDLLLTPIREKDDEERAKDEAYREAVRQAKNKQKQPDNPKPCIRIQGVVSRSSLLNALQNARRNHIFTFFPEIATLTNQRRRGAWSDIDDFLRMAFDNDEYRQAYMSSDTFNGQVKLFLNLLMTGTPQSRAEFFRDIEGGLVQRTAFAILPDEFGKGNPIRTRYTEAEEEAVIAVARRLEQQHGMITCNELEQAISKWCEEKGTEAIETGSRACDMLRRRSAVIGYRAGMLCYILEGCLSGKVIPFAEWVAEYVFQTQMKLFGAQIEALYAGASAKRGGSKLLNSLPSPFTRDDVKEAYIAQGAEPKKASRKASNVIDQWLRLSKKIHRLEDGRYEKIS